MKEDTVVANPESECPDGHTAIKVVGAMIVVNKSCDEIVECHDEDCSGEGAEVLYSDERNSLHSSHMEEDDVVQM